MDEMEKDEARKDFNSTEKNLPVEGENGVISLTKAVP